MEDDRKPSARGDLYSGNGGRSQPDALDVDSLINELAQLTRSIEQEGLSLDPYVNRLERQQQGIGGGSTLLSVLQILRDSRLEQTSDFMLLKLAVDVLNSIRRDWVDSGANNLQPPTLGQFRVAVADALRLESESFTDEGTIGTFPLDDLSLEDKKTFRAPTRCGFCKRLKTKEVRECVCVEKFPKQLAHNIKEALPASGLKDEVDKYLKKVKENEREMRRMARETEDEAVYNCRKCDEVDENGKKGHNCKVDRFPRPLLERVKGALPSDFDGMGEIDTYLQSERGEVNTMDRNRYRGREGQSTVDPQAAAAQPSSSDGDGAADVSNDQPEQAEPGGRRRKRRKRRRSTR